MNQKVETKKVGRQHKLINKCAFRCTPTEEVYVGCSKCKTCPLKVKEWVNEEGTTIYHCEKEARKK